MKMNKYCEKCGGKPEFQRCDMNRVYYRCGSCGYRTCYTFRDEEEATRYLQDENRKILLRVREGLVDWEMTQWDQLHVDIVKFISTHPYATNDIRFQMAKIACITRGFHIMDEDIYQRCQNRFIVTEEIYKGLMNLRKEQMDTSRLLNDLEDYEQARTNYIYLKTEYTANKIAKGLVKTVLKTVAKPYMAYIPLPF